MNGGQFRNNVAATSGGAIYLDSTSSIAVARVMQTIIAGNSAAADGGGVAAVTKSRIELHDCVFTDNWGRLGGAAAAVNSILYIYGCSFATTVQPSTLV